MTLPPHPASRPRRSRLALLACAAATLATGLAGLTTSPAVAVAPTCAGQPATIVGTPGQDVVGTAGRDVIVADEPARVDAGAGADVVCVTSDSDGTTARPFVDLGAGADVYVGSAPARIDTGDREDVAAGHAPSRDLVTASGSSTVASGAPGATDLDTVDLTHGVLTLYGLPAGHYDGGALTPEADTGSSVILVDDGRHAWNVDEQHGLAQIDDRPAFVMRHFQGVNIWHLTWSSFTYRGTNHSDRFQAERAARGSGPLDVRLRGGDDSASFAPNQHVTAAGGRGTFDMLALGRVGSRPQGHLVLHQDHLWRAAKHPRNHIKAFEAADVNAVKTATIYGTPHADDLSVDACRASVRGHAGDDSITLSRTGPCGKKPGPFKAYGNRGDDTLTSTIPNAVLAGGPGTDRICGQASVESEAAQQCG